MCLNVLSSPRLEKRDDSGSSKQVRLPNEPDPEHSLQWGSRGIGPSKMPALKQEVLRSPNLTALLLSGGWQEGGARVDAGQGGVERGGVGAGKGGVGGGGARYDLGLGKV